MSASSLRDEVATTIRSLPGWARGILYFFLFNVAAGGCFLVVWLVGVILLLIPWVLIFLAVLVQSAAQALG